MEKYIGCLIAFVLGSIAVLVAFCMYVVPVYQVWSAGEAGQAELAQADYNRQTQVVEAHANLEAQNYNAQSEVVRARGVATANNIVKGSISDMYIRYLWVQSIDKLSGEHTSIIYVPTEAGLPVTEAGRAVPQPTPTP